MRSPLLGESAMDVKLRPGNDDCVDADGYGFNIQNYDRLKSNFLHNNRETYGDLPTCSLYGVGNTDANNTPGKGCEYAAAFISRWLFDIMSDPPYAGMA